MRGNLIMIAGVLLIVLALVALSQQGVSYATRKGELELGPIPLPLILSGAALIAGVLLVIVPRRIRWVRHDCRS